MQTFSQESLRALEHLAPHLLPHIHLADDHELAFREYTLPEDATRFVCYGCGYLPHDVDGEYFLIEPSLERLRAFLLDPQSRHFFTQNIVHISIGDEPSLRALAWTLFDKPFALVDGYGDNFQDFATAFFTLLEGTEHLFQEYADFGVLPVTNAVRNLRMPYTPPDVYKGVYHGWDAIVIGAGPSLDAVLPLLRTLAHDCVLIGCGSAIQKLADAGITPDFATYLDPAPPEERYASLSCPAPLVFLSRLDPAVRAHFTGPHLLVGANGCHPLEAMFLEAAGVEQVLQGGWNAATLGVEWAQYLGCTTVYTAGVDNTLTGYAGGIAGDSGRKETEVREVAAALQGIVPISTTYVPETGRNKPQIVQKTCIPSFTSTVYSQIFDETCAAVQALIEEKQPTVLYSFELEQSPLFEPLLSFLWPLWEHRFEQNDAHARLHFFHNILTDYCKHWKRSGLW